MKRVIDYPQASDMGSGVAHYEDVKGMTLDEFLKEYPKKVSGTWGVITIYLNDMEILRKFDYSLANNSSYNFYTHLSWRGSKKIDKVTVKYCFNGEDINIYLE